MSDNTITEQQWHFEDVSIGHRGSPETRLDPGSLGRVRPARTTESVLLSDDEGDGRFAGLLRQQERQLGHSAVTCLERTTLSSPPALPKGLEGMWCFQANSTT